MATTTGTAALLTTGRYVTELLDLYDWFSERLPAYGTMVITPEAHRSGADGVPYPHSVLVREADRVWGYDRGYKLDNRQLTVAFFAAAKALKLIEVEG